MSKYKTLLVVSYIELLVWWVIIFVLGEELSVGNALFSLSIGLFAICFSCYLAYKSIHYRGSFSYCYPIVLFLCGFVFFGLGCTCWFYYDVYFKRHVPFPSSIDILYIMQSLFTFVAFYHYIDIIITGLPQGLYKKMVKFCAIFISSTVICSFLYALLLFQTTLNFERFLLIYYPYESLSFIVLFTFYYIKYLYRLGRYAVFLLGHLALGRLAWFIADSIFVTEILSGRFYSASYSDFFYITGLYIALLGIVGLMDEHEKERSKTLDGIYMQEMTYFRPTRLN